MNRNISWGVVVVFLCTLFSGNYLKAADISDDVVKEDVYLLGKTKNVIASLQLKRVSVTEKSGGICNGLLISLFEPISGLTWWVYQLQNDITDIKNEKSKFIDNYRLSIAGNRIISFLISGGALWIRESALKLKSIEELTNVIDSEMRSRYVCTGDNSFFREINLFQGLGYSYFGGNKTGGPGIKLKIKSFKISDYGWEFSVINEDNNQAYEFELLNSLNEVRPILNP